ncbi:sigma-70 family RNA polymerase sigma factor [Algoriphagus sp.]|uniref:RNA polymerase sigma factor n=1 Tax=Algoriphagus sp. TaxID=1872435 RepID=UPI00326A4829
MGTSVNLFISKSLKKALGSHADDAALWESVRKGNDLAFSNLYQRFSHLLFNYGMHVCHNPELVKDCIQELFTSIWTRHETISQIESVKFYLFKSFRNLLVHQISRDRKLFADYSEEQENQDDAPSAEQLFILGDTSMINQKRVSVGLEKISKRQREIVVLKFFNDLSYKEIADIMSLTPASAHNLLSKALQCLRVVVKITLIFMVIGAL